MWDLDLKIKVGLGLIILILASVTTYISKIVSDVSMTNMMVRILFIVFVSLICYTMYGFYCRGKNEQIENYGSIDENMPNELKEYAEECDSYAKEFTKKYNGVMIQLQWAHLVIPGLLIILITYFDSASLELDEFTRMLMFCSIFFYFICVIISMFQAMNVNTIISIIVLIGLYLLLLILGSMIFGFVQLPQKLDEKAFNSCISSGLFGFFNYPTKTTYFYLGQYILGKFIEWFFLGALSGLLIKQFDIRLIEIKNKEE